MWFCWFQSNSSWLGSLIGTVIGNLKLSITNIHIRYEDEERYETSIDLVSLSSVNPDDVRQVQGFGTASTIMLLT